MTLPDPSATDPCAPASPLGTPRAQTAADLRTVRDDLLVPAYERAREVLSAAHLRGNDLIMLSHPIKAPFLEMYDSLCDMADEIEQGQWQADDSGGAT